MSKPDQSAEGMQEAFIHLDAKGLQEVEDAIEVIEDVGGRVLNTFVPSVIIAQLPANKARGILGRAGIRSVDTGEISDEQLKIASDEIRLAATMWNEHLRKRRLSSSEENLGRGLPWDAGGRLPPDAPPQIQEMLRRREREMKSED